jgi:hypothetical protein
VLDWRREDKINEKGFVRAQVQEAIAHGFSERRKKQVFRAFAVVTNAKILFDKSDPCFPKERVDYKVAKASSIHSVFSQALTMLAVTDAESAAILSKLKSLGDRRLCFSQLLLLVHKANYQANFKHPSQYIGGSKRDYRKAYEIDPGMELYATLFGVLKGGE